MPYIITTHRPGKHELSIEDGDRYSRRAVATLDEARDACKAFTDDAYAYRGRYHADADAVPEAGGTIGPLPDGTVVEVERVEPHAYLTDEAYVAAYNANEPHPTDAELKLPPQRMTSGADLILTILTIGFVAWCGWQMWFD